MPTTPDEARVAAEAIGRGEPSEWGRGVAWPAERIQAGDWTPCQWYDGGLAHLCREIAISRELEPAGLRHRIGPAGRRIQDAFHACEADAAGGVRLFWSVNSQLRQTMTGHPEAWRTAKAGKERLAARYWRQRSHLLVAQRYRTTTGRITALWTAEPAVGSGWTPVAAGRCGSPQGRERAKALTAWWNSTPVRLLLLNQRTRLLDYPSWSLTQLRQIAVPKPENPAWSSLTEAFRESCEMELLPLKDADKCRARRTIDEAAALALNVSRQDVAEWRQRLAAEPTVTNRRAARARSGSAPAAEAEIHLDDDLDFQRGR